MPGKRLLKYKDLVAEYGQNPTYWRSQYWKGNIKNVNDGQFHLFDRIDIEKLLEERKNRNTH